MRAHGSDLGEKKRFSGSDFDRDPMFEVPMQSSGSRRDIGRRRHGRNRGRKNAISPRSKP